MRKAETPENTGCSPSAILHVALLRVRWLQSQQPVGTLTTKTSLILGLAAKVKKLNVATGYAETIGEGKVVTVTGDDVSSIAGKKNGR